MAALTQRALRLPQRWDAQREAPSRVPPPVVLTIILRI